MKAKLFKTGNQYLLRSENGEVLAITDGNTVGRKLSLKNCQAIERRYDLDELAEYNINSRVSMNKYPKDDKELFIQELCKRSFIQGAEAILELLGDKKFTEEDIRKAMDRVWDWCEDDKDDDCSSMTELRNKHIKSLQQNEWDVEIEMDICGDKVYVVPEPKLDADGCLILKRVTD